MLSSVAGKSKTVVQGTSYSVDLGTVCAVVDSPDEEVRTRAKRMLRNWNHLFTFLSHDGVEPTNNAAEQALRPAVQWRKLCFGNQSEAGERFTERILTVTRTCQLRGKNPFHFLSELMEAAFNRMPRPSLLH